MSIVYLIGAGPGDPGLITVRGLQCLMAADVVLYDHLVNPRLLRHARPDAEKIDVGVAAPQTIDQDAICYLLAEKAREGKTVARLKWGDPFVFDTGGAEGLFLHEQGIRFEVVPGVPVCIAAPSYCGVPTTYSGGGDTITLIRGYEDGKAQRDIDVDWTSLSRLDGTLICYAGPQQIPKIVSHLISHGRPPDESAAVVYDGTLPTQESLVGSLAEVGETDEAVHRPPARRLDRRSRRRAARTPAVVRLAPAVREARPRHAATRSVRRARRAAGGDGRRSDRSADDPHRAARQLRGAGRRLRARGHVRLDRVLEHQRRRRIHRAAARCRPSTFVRSATRSCAASARPRPSGSRGTASSST